MIPGRRRSLSILAALLLVAATAATAVGKQPDPPGFDHGNGRGLFVPVQLLAFNDYHGHLEASTPGMIDGVAAGGAEYLAAELAMLRKGHKNSLTVAAGDLIGGSPAFSGLFHDEPSVESLNAMHLDVSSVGNHEFDEGVTELIRMQYGGCHPVDGCYFPHNPYGGANFKWLAANVVNETTGKTPLPPYWIKKVDGVKVGFIGMTLEATDTIVAAAGIQGWDFLDEAETANKLVPKLKKKGVETIVVLLHEGGSQTPPPGDVDACVGISGPIVAINDALDPEIDAVITGHTHLPYNCLLDDPSGKPRIVTSAYSYGRVVSEINLMIDKRSGEVRRNRSTAVNHVVVQADLKPDPKLTSIIAKWQPLYDAAGTTPVGTITADINRGGNPPGSDRGVESAAGNLVADAQLWSTSASGAQVAFMNPGGLRSDLTFADFDRRGRWRHHLRRGLHLPAVWQHAGHLPDDRGPDHVGARGTVPATRLEPAVPAPRGIGGVHLRPCHDHRRRRLHVDLGVQRDAQRRRARPHGDVHGHGQQLPCRRR